MSGTISRGGFLFQDLYLLRRILEAVVNGVGSALAGAVGVKSDALGSITLRFGLEARPADTVVGSTSDTRDWDVVVLDSKALDLAELKSGAVTKDDRIAFWRRLRRELLDPLSDTYPVHPKLVVDPDKLENLGRWEALAAEAAKFSGAVPADVPDRNVTKTEHLLEEALWHLCGEDTTEAELTPVSLVKALQALKRFLVEAHRFAKLQSDVESSLTLLFPNGMPEATRAGLLGWMNSRAVAVPTRKFFTVSELLADQAMLHHSLAFQPGTLERWHQLWRELPKLVKDRTRTKLGETGRSVPIVDAQQQAVAAAATDQPALVVARGGAGKSVFLLNLVRQAEAVDLVFICGANDVANAAEVVDVAQMLRFRCTLLRLATPEKIVRFFLDGLEEAEGSLGAQWVRELTRLAADYPEMRLMASIRERDLQQDGYVQKQLTKWKNIPLSEWSSALVESLLKPHGHAVSGELLKVLQTPIMLDVFWRTFVEHASATATKVEQLRSRHDLLTAFWLERVVKSPRYTYIDNLPGRLTAFALRAANFVGVFPSNAQDAEAIQVLRGEGILDETSRLAGTRLSFRHALLRDYVFAVACLSAGSAAGAAERWFAIKGGWERDGALRAVAEALLDPSAAAEFGDIRLGSFIGAALTAHPEAALPIAQFMAEWKILDGLDPAGWDSAVIAGLPASFGSQLIHAAKSVQNPAWAVLIEAWPASAPWTDDEYLGAAIYYAAVLGQLAIGEASFGPAARAAARAVRRLAQATRYAAVLAENSRFLASEALRCAVPELPDAETLAWIREELEAATYRTRPAILENLKEFPPALHADVVEFYCAAVGMDRSSRPPRLDRAIWGNNHDIAALEESLTGTPQRPGLVQRSPGMFLPVLVDLAEAHQRLDDADPSRPKNQIIAWLQGMGEPGSATDSGPTPSATDWIDDHPETTYWRPLRRTEVQQRLLTAVDTTSRNLAKTSLEDFLAQTVPLLRASPLASIHTILLDIFFDYLDHATATRALVPSLLDPRLHDSSGTEYWLRVGLERAWSEMTGVERAEFFGLLRQRLVVEPDDENVRQLLSRIPGDQVPADLAGNRYADGADEIISLTRPNRVVPAFTMEAGPVERYPAPGVWPLSVDQTALDRLRHAVQELPPEPPPGAPPPADLCTKAQAAVDAATTLLPLLQANKSTLTHPANSWCWNDYVTLLNYLTRHGIGAPLELVQICGALAFEFLESLPQGLHGDLPTKSPYRSPPNIPWRHALELADAALVHPPLLDDAAAQQKLVALIERILSVKDVWLEYLCISALRAYHWTRSPKRQTLLRRFLLRDDIEPELLKFAISTTQRFPAHDRVTVIQWLLDRPAMALDPRWAEGIGQYCGYYSVCCTPRGRDPMRTLAETVLAQLAASTFLAPIEHQRAYLHGFAFGMKEQVNKKPGQSAPAASDFGRWYLAIWRFMHEHGWDEETYGVIVFALVMIEVPDSAAAYDPRPWWTAIVPMLREIVDRGTRPDCGHVFFHFRRLQAVRAAGVHDLLDLFERWTNRVIQLSGAEDMNAHGDRQHDHWSWRNCAGYVGDSVGALESIGSIGAPVERDRAYQVLARLANPPVHSPKAAAALHRLRPSRG